VTRELRAAGRPGPATGSPVAPGRPLAAGPEPAPPAPAPTHHNPHRLLIVDDEPSNTELLGRLLRRWGYTEVASTNASSQAARLYDAFAPDLLLLDLHMPAPSGFELLATLPREAGGVAVPVLALTADVSAETKRRALEAGASDFLAKPFDHAEVRLRVANLLRTRRLELDLLGYGRTLEQRVEERTRELDVARRETLAKLAIVAELRDDSTGEHIHRVGRTTALLASQLGACAETVETMRQAAPLHDVGKIGIPDTVLLKAGRLDSAEREQMMGHAELGARILGGSLSPVLAAAEEIALTHHERWDGKGYPAGLAGHDIPLSGRLVAVADVYDALTQARPYKAAWPVDRAVGEILDQRGRHFDPAVVDAFAELDAEALTEPVPPAQRGWLGRAA
jgi:putative two-component system response regulator